MANSYEEYTSLSGILYATPSNFLSINDIFVKGYNGSAWTTLTISQRSASAKTVTLSSAPSSYQKIRVYRMTSSNPLVDFQNGSTLTADDLDTSYQQGLLLSQEVAEDADPDGGSGIGNISNSQLAGGITNDKLAGGIADDKLASGVGTSANNLVKLDGTAKLPAVDGSQLTNVGGGKVLQVKQTHVASTIATTSTSFVTSGVAINITPAATSSKVLLRANIGGFYMLQNDDIYATIYRGSTNLGVGNASTLFYVHNDGAQNRYGNGSMEILDSPNTTSQVTYTIYFRTGNSNSVELNRPETGLFFTAMEIEG